MARTPDRFPGPREDEELLLDECAEDPTAPGGLRFVDGAFRMRDDSGVFDPRLDSAGGEAQHDALDTLVHDLAESSFLDLTRDSGGRIFSMVYWTNTTKTKKIREMMVTRDSQNRASVIQESQYDGTGALKGTLTTIFSRNAAGRMLSATIVET